ncbi:sugar hydrolase [Chitinophaga caeni]|uniref:Sugar hydrolase n=1 Tax=Chitinophaga caeni TaxID=2029983 RepID=A0A291QYS6_9BACT|nr:GH92 family glycosyl hydrolase [Chitinophaga caeni]ATL49098.1 sugar hydrolase [Chitinophaga caeni]
MKKHVYFGRCFSVLAATAVTFTACDQQQNQSTNSEQSLVQYVDPYIGSGGHGHVFVGANVPFGAVQLGPTNIVKGWDWCSGYHYSDSVVIGFQHTHLSGTGIGDLGDVLMMPFTGDIRTEPGTQENPTSGYGSHYTHDREKVAAGYYSVHLTDYDIDVELTASERVGFHKYAFNAEQPAHVIVDLKEGIGWDRATDTHIEQVDSVTFVGYRMSNGWAADQRLWFAIKSNIPVKHFEIIDLPAKEKFEGLKSAKAVMSFDNPPKDLQFKVGISPVSSENALANIQAEIPGWDFAKVKEDAGKKWNDVLAKVSIETKDTAAKRTFYTALYHTMIAPALFNDHDGSYRGTDKEVYKNPGFDNYSVFSLWDVYRSAAPLNTLINPDKVNDFVNTMLTIYKQQGKLPIWHLMGNETNCMVGYHAVPIIVDAYLKGFDGFDAELAFEALKASSTRDDFGMNYIKEKGYIPADKEEQSVSKALEYAIDDWCIAAMAKKMGKQEDYEYYAKRAKYYKNYWDASIRFVRPKLDDGSWRTPYNPFFSKHENGDFTEGNGWQYTWLVPQDVEGLIELMGGDQAFSIKLDSLFSAEGYMGDEASSDISGLIGMYAHGNEPSHHVTYMYAFAGDQWKTAEKVRQVIKEFYFDRPEGLAGNEDCGAMSSWYIMSALGFYPENPANGVYVLGSPIFDKATFKVSSGKTFTVETVNNEPGNIYIQKVEWNGKPYTKSYIRHKDILSGGTFKVFMGKEPNKEFGKAPEDRPKSWMD